MCNIVTVVFFPCLLIFLGQNILAQLFPVCPVTFFVLLLVQMFCFVCVLLLTFLYHNIGTAVFFPTCLVAFSIS